MRAKYVTPAVGLSAFSCPHCGTLTSQTWYAFYSSAEDKAWDVWAPETAANFREAHLENEKLSEAFWSNIERQAAGEIFAEGTDWNSRNVVIRNAAASRCRECDGISIWLYDRLLWPASNVAPDPNADLPQDIVRDYLEAGSILAASPRGAAALLRLCLQKLCAHLLGPASRKSIDDDIGTLVSKGLDARIQKALDIVRVVGNEAVHPGTMDLRDDRVTAEELFRLINIIADVMITQPARIDEIYSKLPPEKIKGIEQRNARVALPKPDSK